MGRRAAEGSGKSQRVRKAPGTQEVRCKKTRHNLCPTPSPHHWPPAPPAPPASAAHKSSASRSSWARAWRPRRVRLRCPADAQHKRKSERAATQARPSPVRAGWRASRWAAAPQGSQPHIVNCADLCSLTSIRPTVAAARAAPLAASCNARGKPCSCCWHRTAGAARRLERATTLRGAAADLNVLVACIVCVSKRAVQAARMKLACTESNCKMIKETGGSIAAEASQGKKAQAPPLIAQLTLRLRCGFDATEAAAAQITLFFVIIQSSEYIKTITAHAARQRARCCASHAGGVAATASSPAPPALTSRHLQPRPRRHRRETPRAALLPGRPHSPRPRLRGRHTARRCLQGGSRTARCRGAAAAAAAG